MKKRVQWCDAATWAYPVKGTPECARDHVEFLWVPQPLKHLLLRVECVYVWKEREKGRIVA